MERAGSAVPSVRVLQSNGPFFTSTSTVWRTGKPRMPMFTSASVAPDEMHIWQAARVAVGGNAALRGELQRFAGQVLARRAPLEFIFGEGAETVHAEGQQAGGIQAVARQHGAEGAHLARTQNGPMRPVLHSARTCGMSLAALTSIRGWKGLTSLNPPAVRG